MDEALLAVVAVFADEAKDLGAAIERGLLQAGDAEEPAARRAHLDQVLRATHTLKGSAASLGLIDAEALAHTIESALHYFRAGALPLPAPLIRDVLASLDDLLVHVQAVRTGAPPHSLEAWREKLLQSASPFNVTPLPFIPSGVEETRPLAPSLDASGAAIPSPLPSSPSPISPRPSSPTLFGSSPSVAVEADTVRVRLEHVARLDVCLDRLRESRGAFQARLRDVQRMVGTLDRASNDGLDRVATKALRALAATSYRSLAGDVAEFDAQLAEFDEELRIVRQVPLETALRRVERAIKEHALSVDKKVRLTVIAPQMSLDRRLLEVLREMLLHLGRNAIDHGIETPAERLAADKAEYGQLTLRVESMGDTLKVSFSDDGRGIDEERVRAKAVELGLVDASRAPLLTPQALQAFLLLPGFSTAQTVSLTSGRGVGLDVVSEQAKALGGRMALDSMPNRGTNFTLELPSSLMTARVLMVIASGHHLAIALADVERGMLVDTSAGSPASVLVDDQPLPVEHLGTLLGLVAPVASGRLSPLLILRSRGRSHAVMVEVLLGERDVVTRALPPALAGLSHLGGAVSQGDGTVAFLVEVSRLFQGDVQPAAPKAHGRSRPLIIVADDSVTTRAVHRQTLLAEGFEVRTATDGEEALRLLDAHGADLIVSDVRMPHLDGLGLARRVRAHHRYSKVPVVLVSSLEGDADIARATEAGAAAYIAKGAYLRGHLVNVVKRLLGLGAKEGAS